MPRTKAKSTTKKIVKRTTAKKTAVPKENTIDTSRKSQTSTTKTSGVRIRKSYAITAFVLIVLASLLYIFRGLFVAAVVNGQPISRFTVISELEKQQGKQVLDSLITRKLVEQEAQREHVTVSDKEVNDQMNQMESTLAKQNQKLDSALQAQNMTRNDLKKLIVVDKLAEKMLAKRIKITDKDIQTYIDNNKDTLLQDQSPAQLNKLAHDKLYQEKLNEEYQPWLDGLRAKAQVSTFVSY